MSSRTTQPSSQSSPITQEASLVETFRSGERIRLARLSTRLPLRVHSSLPLVEEANALWTRRYLAPAFPNADELERQVQEHAGLWACYLAPLISTESQILTTEWTTLLFVIDDHLSIHQQSPRALAQRVLHVMEHGTAPDPPSIFDAALADLWGRTAAVYPTLLLKRLAERTRRYLHAVRAENTYRRTQALPRRLHDFLRIRREAIDLRFFFALIEGGMSLTLPEATFTTFEEATLRALEHIALVNDLLSFRNERFSGETFNAINMICAQHHTPLQAALNRLCQLIDHTEKAFIASRDRALENTDDRAVATYLDALGYAMAGNQHWSYITPRYHGHGFTWNGVKQGTLVLHRDRTTFILD